MAVFLNLFFDDYGLPSGKVWIFIAFMVVIISIIVIQASYADDDVPAFKVLTILALFFALFYSVHSMNPYSYIPISGADIQKANLKRCTANKTVNLENIKDIMADCKKKDQELKFNADIESLAK